ncbi:MAG: helix-turn-helix domain-containing protein [Chloroflexota bacterium]
MKKQVRRSDCPINFSLETFGDRWSLLIIRDMVYFGKKTYGEFLNSDECIATNILASRLLQLEQDGILVKSPCETDKRKEFYTLTEKGLDLIPVLFEMACWGAQHDPQTGAPQVWLDMVLTDRDNIIKVVRAGVQNGQSIFAGENSIFSQLTR